MTKVGHDVPERSVFGQTYHFRLAFVVSILVPAVLFVGGAWYDRTRLFQDAVADARQTAAVLGEHARTAIETHELLVRQVDRRIRGLNWAEIRAAGPALSAEMRAMHDDMPQAYALYLTDAEGRQWISSVPGVSAARTSFADREYWAVQRDADRGTFISRAYIGANSGRLNFGISRRRNTPDGSFDGTVHVSVATQYFSDFWAEAVDGRPNASVSLVRIDGEVLARYPASDAPLPRLPDSPLLRRLQTQTQSGVYQGRSAIDGLDRIFGYAKIGAYPLVIVDGISVASVSMIWWRHVLVLAAACVLAAAVLAFGVLSARRQALQLAAEQLRRAAAEDAAQEGQRLELLGQLAAGVAHDFRNIVQSVQGGAKLIERSAANPERVVCLARMVGEAGEQGASLTRRMLDVARRDTQAGENASCYPAAAVENACALLSRTLGSLHQLHCEADAEGLPALVRGGQGAIEAAVINLVVNARDAMPDGGEVTVRVTPDRQPAGLKPGLYARVTVADTGPGMAPEVLARAGELFFTTKPRGQGTGLGLAGVRGFVERAGGRLSIDSVSGRGTNVTFWLPSISAPASQEVGEIQHESNGAPLLPMASETGVRG